MANLTISDRIRAFESRYRADHEREHALLIDAAGNVIAREYGDADSVHFEDADLTQARGGCVTHTHPKSLPPSGADVALAAQYGVILRAVGTAPDTGQQIDYTLAGLQPSFLALMPAVFDDAVEQAERELAHLPVSDLAWQRESRHLALSRLANQYGFAYERVMRGQPLSEAARAERARLSVLSQVDQTLYDRVFAPLHAQLVRLLVQSSVGGIVPVTALARVRRLASAMVQRTMLGRPDETGLLSPYASQNGQVKPNSPFAAVLLWLMRNGASAAIERHADIMRRYLDADVAHALEYATVSPFRAVSEASYDPLHLWLGKDGKRLSDRIWNAAGDMRRKLDEYLTQAIARNLPVDQMAKDLEAFLQPGKGSYEAYRLARTETAAAYARADYLAAQGNPFAESYRLVTSPAHQCCDECDIEERNGPYPKDDPTHLPPRHPNCICTVVWIIVKNTKTVMKALRGQIDRAVAAAKTAFTDVVGPLSKRFIDFLFKG